RSDVSAMLTLSGEVGGEKNERQQRRRTEDQQKVAKTAAGYNAANKTLMVLIMKMIMQLAQTRRTVEGILFDVVLVPHDMPEATRMAEQGAKYNEQVQAKGKGHSPGAPHLHVFGGLLEALINRQESIGKANLAKLQEMKGRLSTMDYADRMDVIKFTKLDRCYDQTKRRITLCLGDGRKE
ncbi:unnamed protein product, partial [Prorocentrum cordatum]